MSDLPPTPDAPTPGGSGAGEAGAGESGVGGSSRQASVQLRAAQTTDSRRDSRSAYEPANQSLGDALKISFRALQLAMVILGVLFVLSGVTTVQENERGIRLLFGAPSNSNIEPGADLSLPHPIGEMVTVDTGAVTLPLDRPFFVRVAGENPDFAVDRLPRPSRLDPTQHGSLITADGAIVHTRWQVIYRRRDHLKYAERIDPETERELVLTMVRRAAVHAVSRVTIDDLLKQSSGSEGSVARVARRLTQASLDELDCGIEIENLFLVDKIPPTTLIEDFNSVAEAESEAGQRREVAEQARRTTLNEIAGPAAGVIVDAIEDYDRAITAGDGTAQDDALARVFALLDGEIEGQPAVSGDVSRIIQLARVDAANVVRQAEGGLELFQAKLEQFRANPSLMLSRDWNDARNTFLASDRVQVLRVPGPTTQRLELVINQDPDIAREIEQASKTRQQEQALREREDRLREERRRGRGN